MSFLLICAWFSFVERLLPTSGKMAIHRLRFFAALATSRKLWFPKLLQDPGWKSVSDTVWVMSPTVFREEKALRLLRIWSGWMQNQGLGAGTEKLHGDRKAVTAIINYIQVQW